MTTQNADKITLQDILSYAPDNQRIFNEIVTYVNAGANTIVPFVGAGLSQPVYHGWGKSLSTIAEKIIDTKVKEKINNQINSKEFLAAAQALEDKRQPINLCQDFAEIYSPLELKKNISTIRQMAVWLLPLLFEGIAVTTNLDRMLEFVYNEYANQFSHVLLPGERSWLRNKSLQTPDAHYLYKFHGTIEADGNADYSSIVFTESSYDKHYAPNSDLINTLKDIYKKKVLLFLGCSLEKDRTLDVLSETIEPGRTNYAIINCKKETIDLRTEELGKLGIRAIFYPDGKFEAVRILLEALLEKKNQMPINHFNITLAIHQ